MGDKLDNQRGRDYKGEFIGLVNEGTLIGVSVRMSTGNERIFYGDHRPMMQTFDGIKKGDRLIIHYTSAYNWTVEFPDRE